MLSADREQRFGVSVQLLLGISHMNERDRDEHHALVAGGQVIQKLLGLLPLLLQVIGDNSGEVVVLILLPLPVGDVGLRTKQTRFDFLDRFIRGNWDDVNRQHKVPVDVTELGYHRVLHVGGILPKVQNAGIFLPDLDIVVLVRHAVGTDRILEGMPSAHEILQIKVEAFLLSDLEEIVEHTHPVPSIHLGQL